MLLFFQRAKGALQSITAGQKVISKHKNGRFYQCEVVRLTTETFYEVNFDDGSFSDNLYPEDIVVMSARSFLGSLGLGVFLGLKGRLDWLGGLSAFFQPGHKSHHSPDRKKALYCSFHAKELRAARVPCFLQKLVEVSFFAVL